MTWDLVDEQNLKQAQKLIYPIILEKRLSPKFEPADTLKAMERTIGDLRPDELHKAQFFKPFKRDEKTPEGELRPSDPGLSRRGDHRGRRPREYH